MRPSPVFRTLSTLLAATVLATSPLTVARADADPDVPLFPPASQTTDCPQRVHTPPPVDESEVVQPGETTPTPLPVPAPPVGGERLGECGLVADPAAGPTPENLTSKAWLIADLDTGEVIAAQDPHGRYRPASTIKLLLAMAAVDELDLDAPIEATANDWSMEGDACGVGPGGEYTVRDIVTGLLVVSGNDCANMLARALGGYDETLAKMNAKAADLGAFDTRAASPSGLDRAGMSTSPYDLALIFRAAHADETLAEMMGLRSYRFPGYPARADVPGDEDHPAYLMANSNTQFREGVLPAGFTAIGGKTGYTDDALKTFVGAAETNGRRVLIVQMYGLSEPDNSYDQQAVRMYTYGAGAPVGVAVGTLDRAGVDDHSALPGADAIALGVLPLILIVVAALTLFALILVLLRRRRRRW